MPCGSDRDCSFEGSEQGVLRVVGCCVGAFLVGGREGLRCCLAASHFDADVFPAGSVVVQLPGVVFVVAHHWCSPFTEGVWRSLQAAMK